MQKNRNYLKENLFNHLLKKQNKQTKSMSYVIYFQNEKRNDENLNSIIYEIF